MLYYYGFLSGLHIDYSGSVNGDTARRRAGRHVWYPFWILRDRLNVWPVPGRRVSLTPVRRAEFLSHYQQHNYGGSLEACRRNCGRGDCGSRQLCGKSHYSHTIRAGLGGIRAVLVFSARQNEHRGSMSGGTRKVYASCHLQTELGEKKSLLAYPQWQTISHSPWRPAPLELCVVERWGYFFIWDFDFLSVVFFIRLSSFVFTQEATAGLLQPDSTGTARSSLFRLISFTRAPTCKRNI